MSSFGGFEGHHLTHSHEVLRDPGHLDDTQLFFDMTHMFFFFVLFILTTCSIVTGFTRGPARDSLFFLFQVFFKSPVSCCDLALPSLFKIVTPICVG